MEQKDIDFVIGLKQKMNVEQHSVNELWEVYLRTFGRYPNSEKRNACSRCVVNVLNEVHAVALNQPVPDIEEEFKNIPFKPAETPAGKRESKNKK